MGSASREQYGALKRHPEEDPPAVGNRSLGNRRGWKVVYLISPPGVDGEHLLGKEKVPGSNPGLGSTVEEGLAPFA